MKKYFVSMFCLFFFGWANLESEIKIKQNYKISNTKKSHSLNNVLNKDKKYDLINKLKSFQDEGPFTTSFSSKPTSNITPPEIILNNNAKMLNNSSLPPELLDNTFGTSGIASLNLVESATYDVAIQADSKIVTVGHYMYGTNSDGTSDYDGLIVRLNTNGTLDNTFSSDGVLGVFFADSLTDRITDVKVLNDGKILIGGTIENKNSLGYDTDFFIARFTSTGVKDNTFGSNGIIIMGNDLTSFNSYDYLWDMQLDDNGNIYFCGYVNRILGTTGYTDIDGVVVKVNSSGTSIISAVYFATAGSPSDNERFNFIQISPDNKLYATGWTRGSDGIRKGLIVRYNLNLTPDITFSENSWLTFNTISTGSNNTSATNVVFDNNDIFVGISNSRINGTDSTGYAGILALDNSGSIKTNWGLSSSGYYSVRFTNTKNVDWTNLLKQSDKKFILHTWAFEKVTGKSKIDYFRVLENGSNIDTSYFGSIAGNYFRSSKLQSDNKPLFVGQTSSSKYLVGRLVSGMSTTPPPSSSEKSLSYTGVAWPSTNVNYVRITSNEKLRNLTSFTVEFWYYHGGGASGDSWGNQETIIGPEDGGWYLAGNDGKLEVGIGDLAISSSNILLSNNTWQYLTMTYDGTLSSNQLKLFINGELKGSKTGSITSIGSISDVVINRHKWTSGSSPLYSSRFTGKIDELRISKTARYNSSFTAPTTKFEKDANTIALYHFNEGSGTSIVDESGNNINGSISGTMTWSTDTKITSQQADPSITSFTPTSAKAGALITITGSNFGTNTDIVELQKQGTSNYYNSTISSWANTSIIFKVPNVDPGNYTLWVTANSKTVNSSTTFTVLETPTPPAIPRNLVATALSSSQIKLTWDSSLTGAPNKYYIYRSLSSNIGFNKIDEVQSNVFIFTDKNLESYTTYWYYITSINNVGESDPSTKKGATTLLGPPIITGISDVSNDQGKQVYVKWKTNVNFPRYSLWRGDLQNWIFIKEIPSINQNTYATISPTLTDSTKSKGMYYSVFKIVGHYNEGSILNSEPDSGYSIDNLIPTTPGGLFAVFSNNKIKLSWNKIQDEDFNYFKIYRGLNEITDVTNLTAYATSTDSQFVDANISTNLKYYYTITAVDFSGNESKSNKNVIVIPAYSKIEISINHINFGNVKQSSSKDTTLTIKNIGSDTLKVKLWTNSSMFTIQNPNIIIKVLVGSSIGLKITFAPATVGSVNGKLYYEHNSENTLKLDSITLTANVITSIKYGTEIPKIYSLNQNYPNPFNPSTIIRFGLPYESNVKIAVYNSLGNIVDVIANERVNANFYEVAWHAKNHPTGLYIYRIEATDIANPTNKFTQTRKMMLVK